MAMFDGDDNDLPDDVDFGNAIRPRRAKAWEFDRDGNFRGYAPDWEGLNCRIKRDQEQKRRDDMDQLEFLKKETLELSGRAHKYANDTTRIDEARAVFRELASMYDKTILLIMDATAKLTPAPTEEAPY